MTRLTVGDVLEKRIEATAFDELIYLVFSNAVVFYIGQSKRNLVERFWEHVHKPTKLGELISLNKPFSLEWGIKFYTLVECRPFVQQKQLFVAQNWEYFDMTMAEKALIAHFKPVANADFNGTPTPLPAHLKGQYLFAKTAVSHLFSPSSHQRSPKTVAWVNKMRLNGWVSRADANGRIVWTHTSGTIFKDDQLISFRESGTIPPHNGTDP